MRKLILTLTILFGIFCIGGCDMEESPTAENKNNISYEEKLIENSKQNQEELFYKNSKYSRMDMEIKTVKWGSSWYIGERKISGCGIIGEWTFGDNVTLTIREDKTFTFAYSTYDKFIYSGDIILYEDKVYSTSNLIFILRNIETPSKYINNDILYDLYEKYKDNDYQKSFVILDYCSEYRIGLKEGFILECFSSLLRIN